MAALVLAACGTADAATMIVRSAGPSAKLYPPGKALADDAKLALKANDSVTLLDSRGTRTLAGPGQFSASSPATPAAGMATSLAALATGGGARRARIGAVRGALAGPDKSPNVWYVDASKSATICVPDAGQVTLWHPGRDGASATISGAGKSDTATFAKGATLAPWPMSLPVSEGATYSVAWAGSTEPATIKFTLVGDRPTGIEDMASVLIKRGCQRQLDMLIETVAVPPAATGTSG